MCISLVERCRHRHNIIFDDASCRHFCAFFDDSGNAYLSFNTFDMLLCEFAFKPTTLFF